MQGHADCAGRLVSLMQHPPWPRPHARRGAAAAAARLSPQPPEDPVQPPPTAAGFCGQRAVPPCPGCCARPGGRGGVGQRVCHGLSPAWDAGGGATSAGRGGQQQRPLSPSPAPRMVVMVQEAVLLNSLKFLMVTVPSIEDSISRWIGVSVVMGGAVSRTVSAGACAGG